MTYDAELKVINYSTRKITPELRERYPDIPEGNELRIANGNIYADKKMRFDEGEYIHTSWIIEETDEYIRTRNTLYKKR